MAEMLFTLLVLAGVCVLAWRREKTWAWWLAGVCWALAALTRTIAIVLPVVALAGLVLWRQRWQSGAVFLAGFLPLIGLWVARNALLTGHAFYSTAGGNVLVTGWAALSEAEHSGESTSTMHQKLLARAGATEFYDGAAAFARRQSEQGHLLRELAQVNPVQLAGDLARGAGQNLLGPGARTLEPYLQRPRPARPWWPPVYTTALAVVLGLAVWGAVRRWRDLTLLTVLVVCFVVPSAQPTPNSRYRYPILPLLAILAVAGVSAPRRDHVHHGH
jgi:4-amino-4-deoxy-L-arabinose transferase-like glycosyltransferase